MNNKIILLIMFVSLISLSLFNAQTTCNPSLIQQNINRTESVNPVSIVCTNQISNTSVTINSVGNYFSVSPSLPITIGNSPQTLNLNFNSNAPVGEYNGFITFSDGSMVQIDFSIKEKSQSTNQISFPTSKTINVQQGSDYEKKVTMILPTSYPNPINIQTIEFSEDSDIISLGDIETGILNPGEIKDIPLVIHSKDAQVGNYPSISVIVRYGDNGLVKTISSVLNIVVTANLNPSDNSTFNTKPSCSISASVMSLNDTYQFTCSNVQKNLEINPLYNDYFEGVNTILNGNIYTYYFKAVKFGNSEFIANFRYLGAPIFSPFKQEVKISSSGSSVPSTDLKVMFIPELSQAHPGDKIILNLVDNKTNNLVNGAEIFIDYLPLNASDGYTFFYSFDLNRNYFLRARSPGYNDLIISNVSLSSKFMELSINPSSGDSSTMFNISTDVPTSKIFIDGIDYNSSYYGTLIQGNHTIKATASGYFEVTKNLTVGMGMYASLGTEFKKGVEQLISLSTNSTWKVMYLKDLTSVEELYQESNSTSSEIKFTPKKSGFYRIYANGIKVFESQITGWVWKWTYIWWGLIPLAIIVLILVIKNKPESSGMPGLAGNVNYG